ncbi:MAG: universal stress protein [Leptolyngbya sp. SIO1E4]|nr:universal stress protein [Leptolyngbya sp. SIO1E4]
MFSKILVALDPGDTCAALFAKAVTLAQATGAELMLLSVLTPEGEDGLTMPASSGLAYYPLSVSESIWEMYQRHYQEYEAKGLEMLRNFSDQAQAAGVRAEITQVFGSPGHTICNLAKTWEADLVMVGSHGRKGLSEIVLGSVSNYAMHHAPCSILVIHASAVVEAPVPAGDVATVEG